jgi:hypothetical protein
MSTAALPKRQPALRPDLHLRAVSLHASRLVKLPGTMGNHLRMYGSARAQNWIMACSSADSASELLVLTISSGGVSRATDDPVAWLLTAARNSSIDRSRRV